MKKKEILEILDEVIGVYLAWAYEGSIPKWSDVSKKLSMPLLKLRHRVQKEKIEN